MRWGLLVGYGSIGRRHFLELHKHVDNVVVVDPNADVKAQLTRVGKPSVYYNSISDMMKNTEHPHLHFEILVLANWAPDRKKTLSDLQDIKFRRLLIEKPLASSLIDIDWIASFVNSRNIPCAVNFHMRFSRLPHLFHELEEIYGLGPIVKIVELGGAKCFAANGIHWLDFAMFLFGETPISICSNHNANKINPRSSGLNFVDGHAVWGFTRERRFEMSYSNTSSFPSRLQVFYKHALISLVSNKLVVEMQSNHLRDENLPITLTTEPIDSLTLDGIFQWETGEDGISRLYKRLIEGQCRIDEFTDSTRALLYSFNYSRKTDLNYVNFNGACSYKFLEEHEYTRDWRVT